MAQHDYVIANGTGAAVRSDINNGLAAIVTQNSGATEPATTYAYMRWADTTAGVMKMRNGANSAWIELFELDGEFGSKTFNGNITLNAQGDLRFADSDSSNWVAFQSPATVSSNVTWTLPSADGSANQVLSTNGSGTLSWTTPSIAVDKITEGNTEAEVVDTGSDGHFKVTIEGTERLRCDSSGRLLVGTSTANGSALIQVNGGYNILKGFNRRLPLHRGSLFYKTAATAISVVADCSLNGFFYATATAVTMPSHSNNTDYAIWQHPSTGALVGDASFTTAPAGATGGSIVGGYHYIPSGRPTAENNGSPTGSAEILEFSIWDLTYRPSCPDPRGMACINDAFWIDLYLAGATSYAGSTFSAVPSSKIGLTIADGSSAPLVPAQYGGNGSTTYGSFTWYEASEMAASFGKRLPFYAEFAAAAFGAPEAGSRGSDPGTVTWERASKFGLAQATGVMYQWGADTNGNGSGGSWTASTEGRGSVYSTEARAVILGGDWGNGALSGSRNAYWGNTPWNSYNNFGARFAAGHLVLG
jgi:hypothetical protein